MNITKAVEKHRQLILDAERYIWAHPETGYKEYETSKYLADKFRELGYELKPADGITGFCTTLDTGREGPTVLVLGELDSIICPEHPECNKETGAVHSCGHNAQCAALLGIAAALKEDGMLDSLSGKIMLCAVPAEELLELEFRAGLKAEGKIKYFGGKPEFLRRGYFDGVDMAFMVHTSSTYCANGGNVGCVVKSIIYKGRAAHAGGAPHLGINALYAASLGLNAVNALRETFTEGDQIRFHPIITHGGDMVNAIPETARIETYVRGSSFDAITRENKKINRALVGAALSIGANVEIIDFAGYAPLDNNMEMQQIAKDAFEELFPGEPFSLSNERGAGSTDVGDLSCIMPVMQPYAGGAVGRGHGNDYYIADPEKACVDNAKWQLAILEALLQNGAERAKSIIKSFKAPFTKDEYLAYLDAIESRGDRIEYREDGYAVAKVN